MRKAIPIYLIFFAVDYFVMKNLSLGDMALFAGMLLVVTAIIFLVFLVITKEQQRAAFLTLLILSWALYYGSAAQVMQNYAHIKFDLGLHLGFLTIWTAGILIVGSNWVWRFLHEPRAITIFLNMMMTITFLFFSYRVVISEMHNYLIQSDLPEKNINSTKSEIGSPDIYYIILDSYGRADMLESMYGFDNSEFINYLIRHGFYVADKSRNNYIYTALSLTSSLNMSYIQGLPGYQIRTTILEDLIANNQTRKFLENEGYQFITFSTGLYYSSITNSDLFLYLTKDHTLTSFRDSMVLPATLASIPLSSGLLSPGGRTYGDEQQRVEFILDELGKVASRPELTFTFVHLLVPHAPYIYNQDGPTTPERLYALADVEKSDESIAGYLNQITYINKMIEETVNNIINNSENPPIIIIQGDHGPRAYLTDEFGDSSCLYDTVSILNAYYLPGLRNNPVNKDITPVNTFRIIFNQYFQANLAILKDITYYSSGDAAYQFTDVTEASTKPCQIP